MRIVLVTHLASPYQVELFNAVCSQGGVDLQVFYLHRTSSHRLWKGASINHQAIFLDEVSAPFKAASERAVDSDLVIINYYADRLAKQLLDLRASTGRPWCFWGERPGFRKPEWIGWIRRRWDLAKLRTSRAPIWGIGQFAVERYRKEFGPRHQYFNLPYFSDLDRFEIQTNNGSSHIKDERVFLFSGSLITRKGVDLLASAFLQLVQEFSNVRLKLMGEGDLRPSLERILHPVREKVEFLGFKDWLELPSHYASADVLCVPSRYDGWGLVVPEGLAAGLPVIGTDRMGAAIDLLKTRQNGWLVSAGNQEALLDALREAASLGPEDLAALSRGARESVQSHGLRQGAEKFVQAAREAMEYWTP